MADVLPIRSRAGGVPAPSDPPPAPGNLSDEAADLWRSIVGEWLLGSDALPLLRLACEAMDRYRQAAKVLSKDGPVVTNPKSGAMRQHPAHAVCRDNATTVRQCFRQLRLEPPAEVG